MPAHRDELTLETGQLESVAFVADLADVLDRLYAHRSRARRPPASCSRPRARPSLCRPGPGHRLAQRPAASVALPLVSGNAAGAWGAPDSSRRDGGARARHGQTPQVARSRSSQHWPRYVLGLAVSGRAVCPGNLDVRHLGAGLKPQRGLIPQTIRRRLCHRDQSRTPAARSRHCVPSKCLRQRHGRVATCQCLGYPPRGWANRRIRVSQVGRSVRTRISAACRSGVPSVRSQVPQVAGGPHDPPVSRTSCLLSMTSAVVGLYASPVPHAFACGSSDSTSEYFTANSRAADSAP